METLSIWLLGFGLLLSAILAIGIQTIHSFLAVNLPINADALVLEGWIPDAAIEAAIAEFERGQYRWLVTTGVPLSHGTYLTPYKNFAELSAATLLAMGFDPQKLIVLPAPQVQRDRTFTSALALKQWLTAPEQNVTAVNVYSLGTHARRSRLLFRLALEPEIQVGILAAAPNDYDSARWWKFSSGTRVVVSETIAYVYVRLKTWLTPRAIDRDLNETEPPTVDPIQLGEIRWHSVIRQKCETCPTGAAPVPDQTR